MNAPSGYRTLFDALPESGAGPKEWTPEQCVDVQRAIRRSGVFKQTWLREAMFRLIDERLRTLAKRNP